MSGMGENLTPEGSLNVSNDLRWISWTDLEGVTRFYELQNNMSEDTAYAVNKMFTGVGNIAYTVVDEARNNQ
jgi:hypothetical protein